MPKLKLWRKNGGNPIIVPADAVDLSIAEPVSDLVNLGEIIQSLPKLEKLHLHSQDLGKSDATESLDFLQGAVGLKFLFISYHALGNLRNCDALAECKALEWLVISRNVPFDFGILRSLSALRRLRVEMPGKIALKHISNTRQLTDLEALGGFKLPSLESLAGLKNLINLRLWSGSLASSRGLAALTKLESLDLGHSKVQDTSELGAVKGLKKMQLIGNKSISNLEFLQDGELEKLGLFEIPKLDSLKPLLRLSKLKQFDSNAIILDEDLHPLTGVPSLQNAAVAGRYKSALKKIRIDCSCVFAVGRETLKLTKQGPIILQTASQANEKLRKKLGL